MKKQTVALGLLALLSGSVIGNSAFAVPPWLRGKATAQRYEDRRDARWDDRRDEVRQHWRENHERQEAREQERFQEARERAREREAREFQRLREARERDRWLQARNYQDNRPAFWQQFNRRGYVANQYGYPRW